MIRILISAALTVISVSVAAQTAFDSALSTLVNANSQLKALRLRTDADNLAARSENQLPGPEAEFSRVWGSNEDVGDKWSLSVSQSFDWPGVYAARREAAARQRTAAQFLLESSVIDTSAEARQLLLDAIHMRQLLEMQLALAARVDSLEIYFRKGAEVGTETRLDYNKTVIERIAVHRELHSLQGQWQELMAQISTFGGGIDAERLAASLGTDYPPVPAQVNVLTVETLRQRHPGYAAAMAGRDAAESMVKLENRLRLPGFSVGYVHETELGGNFDGFSVGVTIPAWGKNHKAKAARYEAEAALVDAELELLKTRAGMNADRGKIETLRKIIDEYEPVVGSQESVKLLRQALDAGLITFLTYIEESNYFIAARRDYLDTLWEYHSALARLARFD